MNPKRGNPNLIPYSAADIAYLKKNAGYITSKEISVKLNRSIGSVRTTAYRFKVSLRLKINPCEKRDGSTYGVRFDTNEKQQAKQARLLTEVFSGKTQTISQ